MAVSIKLPKVYADLRELVKKIKTSGGVRHRESKASLRKQLKSPNRKVRMRAYKFLRYRLNRRMR